MCLLYNTHKVTKVHMYLFSIFSLAHTCSVSNKLNSLSAESTNTQTLMTLKGLYSVINTNMICGVLNHYQWYSLSGLPLYSCHFSSFLPLKVNLKSQKFLITHLSPLISVDKGLCVLSWFDLCHFFFCFICLSTKSHHWQSQTRDQIISFLKFVVNLFALRPTTAQNKKQLPFVLR